MRNEYAISGEDSQLNIKEETVDDGSGIDGDEISINNKGGHRITVRQIKASDKLSLY